MPTRRILGATLFALLASGAAQAALAADAARLATFREDDHTSYALSLTPELPAKEVDGVDVVVLFDTSASQQGAFREKGLEALRTMLKGLRPTDRVEVVAVDLDARPLTEEFTAGNSAAVEKALATLEQQAPLGSTNIEAGLNAALNRFEAAKSANRAVVYFGDGVSMANLLDAPTLRPLVERLRAARVPVSSYAVGPEVNAQLLAILANQTGGNLYVAQPMVWQNDEAGISDARAREENLRHAAEAGKNLAAWSRATVVWPTKAQVEGSLGQFYPESFPPLRSDRDTVLLGRTAGELTQPAKVAVSAAMAEGEVAELSWTVDPEEPSVDNAYLAAIVDGAERDGGLTLPTVGTAGLAAVAQLTGVQADQLTMLAERAIANGDRQGALRIVQAVLRTDPANVQARTVQNALQGMPAEEIQFVGPGGGAAAVPAPGDIAVPPAAAAPAGLPNEIILTQPPGGEPRVPPQPGELGATGPPGGFLDEVEQERRVLAQVLRAEVNNTVRAAREQMAADPQAAIQELKLALENVRRTSDLDATTRAELTDQLTIALREATRRAAVKDQLDALREAELAAVRERKFIDQQLARRIERESQLMSRFNALMDEGRYVEAEEVATIVEEVDPEGVTPRAAALWARQRRHWYLMMAARSARHNAFWDTMYQMELSSIPFPDNPPIVYPDAPVWEELTRRRAARYSVDLKSEGEAERRIYGALRQPLRAPLEAVAQPLNILMTQISEDYDIPIVFDTAALDAVAISPDVEVNMQPISNVSLRSALELLLKSAGTEDLTYIVDNEVLMITTAEEAEQRLQVRVYPVADLVMPIENIGGSMMGGGMMGGMGGGMMGGMGGGMMGGMGGMGGGMMGGMGGMGGGMGGMGGGGFFAVADNVSPNAEPAPIAEEAAGPAGPAEASTSAADPSDSVSAVIAKTPRVPGIEIDASLAPEAFWTEYFAKKQQDPAVVRKAVKYLMRQKQYDHTIALIQAALAAGQPQPWMYESLGIAMELAGRPKADIERAVMSACDFSTSPEELMLIARYLSHIDLDARALSVYQQIVKAAPLYAEAYALGLRAAQRANDTAGIRWATVGILKQAWPNDQRAIRDTAIRVAKATLEEMKQAGDAAEAAAFQQELDEALIRDCVVKVSWSGDADVDLIVEEPSGTICSLRESRSAGGGVVLGDAYANFEDEQSRSEGFSETYVCPQGFPGEYRVRVRKVWGDLVADRVTVDVYQNYRGKNEKHQRQHIKVTDDDAMVVFNLEQGRRTDPIEAQQLAASINRQEAISQAVLAQQFGDRMNSLSDPSIIPGRGNLTPLDLRRQLALARGGAVGYQPIIITLPDGVTMIAQAVVSADRRYVRISVAPNFSGIGNVTTFTFSGAGEEVDEDDGGGGDNGGGDNGGGDNGGGDF